MQSWGVRFTWFDCNNNNNYNNLSLRGFHHIMWFSVFLCVLVVVRVDFFVFFVLRHWWVIQVLISRMSQKFQVLWLICFGDITYGNCKRTSKVHFVIYGHQWCFESSQNCTSRTCRWVQFENFQNITSDHKSRAGSYDFLFIIFSTKLPKRVTLYALRTT